MKDIPNSLTEGDSDDYLGTEYSSVLDMTPPLMMDHLKIKEDNSLKYSDRSDKSE